VGSPANSRNYRLRPENFGFEDDLEELYPLSSLCFTQAVDDFGAQSYRIHAEVTAPNTFSWASCSKAAASPAASCDDWLFQLFGFARGESEGLAGTRRVRNGARDGLGGLRGNDSFDFHSHERWFQVQPLQKALEGSRCNRPRR
jgi:hypothetical protein